MSQPGSALCKICRQALPSGALKCNECDTYQSWTAKCDVCGSAVHPDASSCTTCKEYPHDDGEPCHACARPLRPGTKLCPHCDSLQTFRGRLKIGNQTITLLIALLSVVGLLASLTADLWPFHGSDSELSFHHVGAPPGDVDQIYVMVANSGDRPSTVTRAFLGPHGCKEITMRLIEPSPENSLIPAGEAKIFGFKHPGLREPSAEDDYLLHVEVVEFGESPDKRQVPVPSEILKAFSKRNEVKAPGAAQ